MSVTSIKQGFYCVNAAKRGDLEAEETIFCRLLLPAGRHRVCGSGSTWGSVRSRRQTRTCLGRIVGPVDAQVQAVSFARQPEKSWFSWPLGTNRPVYFFPRIQKTIIIRSCNTLAMKNSHTEVLPGGPELRPDPQPSSSQPGFPIRMKERHVAVIICPSRTANTNWASSS